MVVFLQNIRICSPFSLVWQRHAEIQRFHWQRLNNRCWLLSNSIPHRECARLPATPYTWIRGSWISICLHSLPTSTIAWLMWAPWRSYVGEARSLVCMAPLCTDFHIRLKLTLKCFRGVRRKTIKGRWRSDEIRNTSDCKCLRWCRYNIGLVTGLCSRSFSDTACVEDKSAVCRWWKNWDYWVVDPHSIRMRATM